MSGFLKPAVASRVAVSKAWPTSSSERTMRMPRPPPPPEALRIAGKPMRRASSRACSASRSTPEPGRSGRPNLCAMPRELTLSPHERIDSGLGPMKASLHLRQISANLAFSERKPYPGWIASAPVISAAAMIDGTLR